MKKPHTDTRRLHTRIKTELAAVMRFEKTETDGPIEVAATIIDLSPDSLSIRVQDVPAIRPGSNVTIEFLVEGKTIILDGQIVRSARSPDGYLRAGITLAPGTALNPEVLTASKPPVDRRQGPRRASNSGGEQKRQYDRRGFWQGLESKRYFSHHAWELKNSNVYFYMKPLQSGTGAHVIVDGREVVMMSSNSYLGLSMHPKVQEAAIKAIHKYGTSQSAPGILGGTTDIHRELETKLALFKGVEAVCLFSSGYVTNTATLSTILIKGDAVFNDERNHASLIDGSRMSGAEFIPFRHSDMKDLDRKLSRIKANHKLIVSDTVFSMDGDIAHLPEIFRIAKKHGAAMMFDEAHATGVFGKNGGGLVEHCGLQGKVDIIMGTMSKSLCSIGGFIGGSRELINILKHSARGLIFSASLPPVMCAVALAVLEIIHDEPERREKLWRNTEMLRTGLRSLGFNTAETCTPIIPVIFPSEQETNMMTKGLQDDGIFVTPVIFPAVKKNATRVRMSVMATHSEQDIEKVLNSFKRQKALVGVS